MFFGCQISQKIHEFFSRITALASKKRSNQKNKGAFNNYVDRILLFFDPLPPAWTFLKNPERGQKQTFFTPSQPSSCSRSYWMPLISKESNDKSTLIWLFMRYVKGLFRYERNTSDNLIWWSFKLGGAGSKKTPRAPFGLIFMTITLYDVKKFTSRPS